MASICKTYIILWLLHYFSPFMTVLHKRSALIVKMFPYFFLFLSSYLMLLISTKLLARISSTESLEAMFIKQFVAVTTCKVGCGDFLVR